MTISVVVPFFNEEEYIGRCIEALETQDFPQDGYEIILVDNNSTDRSPSIAAASERVRLIHESEQGDFAARNRGIAESRGRLIAFTDADTAPLPNWLNRIDAAMQDADAKAVVGGVRFNSASAALHMLAAYENAKMRWIYASGSNETIVGYTCNMAVRRDVIERAGRFPSVRRSADTVFLRRLVEDHGRAAVQYRPDVEVERLEISSLKRYYSKVHVYGKDYTRYSKVSHARALKMSERLAVFREAVSRNGYSAVRATGLLALLVVGAFSYDAGRILKTSG